MSFKARVKQTLATVGYYRESLARSPYHGVAVLAYHGVRDDNLPEGAVRFEALHVRASRLEEHCATLRDLGCTMLSLGDWRQIAGHKQLAPASCAMLTFDDGYRSVLTHALPVLERHGIPATVFLCTNPIERQIRFWFDALAERDGEMAVARAKTLDYDGWREIAEGAKRAVVPGDPHAPLTVDELKQLAAHPLITIGAHTMSHPILRSAHLSVQAQEISKAKDAIEGWIGRAVTAFAYPNGRPGVDYDADTVDIVSRLGFECAFSTWERFAMPSDPPFEHPRFTMLQGVTGPELAHRLAVSWPRAAAVTS